MWPFGYVTFPIPFPPVLIVWDPTPVGALSHGSDLDGNDLLPRHVSSVYYLLGTFYEWWCSQNDYSYIGGSSDAKPWYLGGNYIWEY